MHKLLLKPLYGNSAPELSYSDLIEFVRLVKIREIQIFIYTPHITPVYTYMRIYFKILLLLLATFLFADTT